MSVYVCVRTHKGNLPTERSKVSEECQCASQVTAYFQPDIYSLPTSRHLCTKKTKKNSLYSGHQWEKRPKVTTKSSRGKGRRADWRKWLMIRLKQTETRRGLKPHMSAFGMLWRRSKQYLMAGTELTAQYFKHWAFSQSTAKQYSPSSFPPTSHLPCYPLPIPLRTPLSSPGRDTKGPVRQSNQELPWMAEACISPSIPGYISRQKFI